MKTIKQVLISLAMSLLFINLTVANNYTHVLKIEAGINKKFYLSLENVSTQTSIQIIDQEGFVLIDEKIAASEQFTKIFNMEKLISGHYTLVIKSDYKETIQPIVVTSRELIMEEGNRLEFYPAIIAMEKQNVNVSLFNPTKSKVNFSIIDGEGEVVFRDVLKDQMVVGKRYNLKQLPTGTYTVLVDTSKEVYARDLTIR